MTCTVGLTLRATAPPSRPRPPRPRGFFADTLLPLLTGDALLAFGVPFRLRLPLSAVLLLICAAAGAVSVLPPAVPLL